MCLIVEGGILAQFSQLHVKLMKLNPFNSNEVNEIESLQFKHQSVPLFS